MLITAIEKRRKMLSALFLDGEFAVNIDTETLLQFRYKIGMDITDEQLHVVQMKKHCICWSTAAIPKKN